ncbi:uncharacterized protein [Penaeus vannamei]|uniref:uncharacterized protein n=1 Tax=Penaeus vannamei TaxID=6689 RepID=UPI00387F67DB
MIRLSLLKHFFLFSLIFDKIFTREDDHEDYIPRKDRRMREKFQDRDASTFQPFVSFKELFSPQEGIKSILREQSTPHFNHQRESDYTRDVNISQGSGQDLERPKNYSGWGIFRLSFASVDVLEDVLRQLENNTQVAVLRILKAPLSVDVAASGEVVLKELLSHLHPPDLSHVRSRRRRSGKRQTKKKMKDEENVGESVTWEKIDDVRFYPEQRMDGSETLAWDDYYRFESIQRFLHHVSLHTSTAQSVEYGRSLEGRPLLAIFFGKKSLSLKKEHLRRVAKVRRLRAQQGRDPLFEELKNRRKNGSSRTGRPVVLIEAGIHGNEWISPAVATFLVKKLALAGETFFRSATVVVAPVVNPDGYEYSFTMNVLWRKNRRQTSNPACPGVDLNRNWSAGWGDPSGSSGDPCDPTYRGNRSFSEPEAQALRDLALAWFDKLALHISVHSYGGFILYPWFYTEEDISMKKRAHKIAKKMKKYMRNSGQDRIQIGQGSEVLYKASGVVSDYLSAAGLEHTYILELPGYSFAPPPQRIVPVGRSVWDTLVCAVGDVVGTKESRSFCGKRIVKVTLSDGTELSMWISKDVPLKKARQMILEAFDSG